MWRKKDIKFVDKNAEWGEMKNTSLKCLKVGLLSYGIIGTWSGLVNI